MKDTIIIDLDGTLSDCSERQHLVTGTHRDYAAFHAQLGNDPPNQWCVALMNAFFFFLNQAPIRGTNLGGNMSIMLVTARPKSAKENTKHWLSKHAPLYTELHHVRPDDDDTPAIDLKRAWLRRYGADRILFAVDDDPRNAAMFKEEGVVCLLAPGWV